jgi:hypothetical protein
MEEQLRYSMTPPYLGPTSAELTAAEEWCSAHPPVHWWVGLQQPWHDRVRARVYEARRLRLSSPEDPLREY